MIGRIHQGEAAGVMRGWPADVAQTIVTSPPYWGLRDYGTDGQLGLERTPEEYVGRLVAILREARRVLRDDGTLWLNLGDSYATNSSNGWQGKNSWTNSARSAGLAGRKNVPHGVKPKDLVGIPWLVAFALRADGWYLRSDIIWAKKNCMPESVEDRPTRSHEYVFLLSKGPRYYYDHEAIKEPASAVTAARLSQPNFLNQTGGPKDPKDPKDGNRSHGKVLENLRRRKDLLENHAKVGALRDKQRGHARAHEGTLDEGTKADQCAGTRNKRDVWHVGTTPYSEAHFATFPPALIEPCVLAGAPRGGVVLDPFMGAGTTALVAHRNGRRFVGVEINPTYIRMANRRLAGAKKALTP